MTLPLDGLPAEPTPGPQVLAIFVAGKPAPQGSKRHVGNGVMIESSKKVKPWRQDVREACLVDGQPTVHIPGAVTVRLHFVMPRPLATPKTRTPLAIKKPDIDKLARAVLDSLSSAGVWEDDARVIELHATKRIAELGETTGVHIVVQPAIPAACDVLDASRGDYAFPTAAERDRLVNVLRELADDLRTEPTENGAFEAGYVQGRSTSADKLDVLAERLGRVMADDELNGIQERPW